MGVTITLSREMGSEGEAIAGEVAAALRLRVVGSEIIHQALAAGVPASVAMESDEGRLGFVQRVLDWLRREPAASLPAANTLGGAQMTDAYISGDVSPIGGDYYLSILESIIFDLAKTEDVLLIGRAGQMVLRGKADTLHVRIHASRADRVKVIAERFNLPEDEAQRKVAASDEGRAAYLHRHYKADINDIRLYDLTINTGRLSPQVAVNLIVEAAKAKFGRA
jgi:hypothetical protein